MLHRHQWSQPRVTQVNRIDMWGDRSRYSNFTWICTTPGCSKVKTKKQKGVYELPAVPVDIVDQALAVLESDKP